MNKERLKDMIKTAVVVALTERQDLLQETIETAALEDIALDRAIKEGEKTKPVKRGKVFRILEHKA